MLSRQYNDPAGESVPASLFSVEFLGHYITTMRPYLLFVSGITGLTGLALSGEVYTPRVILFALIFFLSYGFGQALTDCFQTDTDSLSSPYRPLVQGRIRRRDVMIISLLGLSAGGVILVVANPAIIPWALLSIIGLATYTFFKRRWWGGPFYNAWIVGVLCLMGFLAGSPHVALSQWPPAVWATIATAFFGYANFVLIGYYKDVSADRATGYRTLPVTFGFKVAAVTSDIIAMLTAGSFAIAIYLTLDGGIDFSALWLMAPFAIAGLIMLIWTQFKQHKVRDEALAYGAISLVVHTYIILLSAICVAARPGWALPLLAFYIAFVVFMKLRPARQQI